MDAGLESNESVALDELPALVQTLYQIKDVLLALEYFRNFVLHREVLALGEEVIQIFSFVLFDVLLQQVLSHSVVPPLS